MIMFLGNCLIGGLFHVNLFNPLLVGLTVPPAYLAASIYAANCLKNRESNMDHYEVWMYSPAGNPHVNEDGGVPLSHGQEFNTG